MMFKLVVRYLGFLKRLPLLAWVFDAMLMIWNMLFNRELASSIELLETSVSTWPSVNVSIHKYGGRQFNLHQKEIGHVHSNGVLDLIFDRATKAALLRSCAAEEHHVFKNSGWISFYLRSEKDVAKALELLALSYRRTVERSGFSSGHSIENSGKKQGKKGGDEKSALSSYAITITHNEMSMITAMMIRFSLSRVWTFCFL